MTQELFEKPKFYVYGIVLPITLSAISITRKNSKCYFFCFWTDKKITRNGFGKYSQIFHVRSVNYFFASFGVGHVCREALAISVAAILSFKLWTNTNHQIIICPKLILVSFYWKCPSTHPKLFSKAGIQNFPIISQNLEKKSGILATILKSYKDKLSYAIHVCKSIDIDEYAHVNLNEEDRTQNMELIDEQDFINIE